MTPHICLPAVNPVVCWVDIVEGPTSWIRPAWLHILGVISCYGNDPSGLLPSINVGIIPFEFPASSCLFPRVVTPFAFLLSKPEYITLLLACVIQAMPIFLFSSHLEPNQRSAAQAGPPASVIENLFIHLPTSPASAATFRHTLHMVLRSGRAAKYRTVPHHYLKQSYHSPQISISQNSFG